MTVGSQRCGSMLHIVIDVVQGTHQAGSRLSAAASCRVANLEKTGCHARRFSVVSSSQGPKMGILKNACANPYQWIQCIDVLLVHPSVYDSMGIIYMNLPRVSQGLVLTVAHAESAKFGLAREDEEPKQASEVLNLNIVSIVTVTLSYHVIDS